MVIDRPQPCHAPPDLRSSSIPFTSSPRVRGAAERPLDAPPADPFVGRIFADGTVLAGVLGEGRFARVYEGERLFGPSIAIKVATRLDAESLRRFRREIKVLRELPRHPNRVAYLGDGVFADGTPWLALERIQGATLRDVLRSPKRFSERTVCRLMLQLTRGFTGIHQLGLTHGDVSPANILLSHSDRRAKVIDFGLTRDSQGLLGLFERVSILQGQDFADADLNAGKLAGTPAYMAPEQIRDAFGDAVRTDTTADVFSLGVIFFELLAQRRLYPDDHGAGSGLGDRDALRRFVHWRLRIAHAVPRCPDGVTPALYSIVAKAIQPAPAERQRTAAELGSDIEHYLMTGQPVRAEVLEETRVSLDVGALMAAYEDGDGEDDALFETDIVTLEALGLPEPSEGPSCAAAPAVGTAPPSDVAARVAPVAAPLRAAPRRSSGAPSTWSDLAPTSPEGGPDVLLWRASVDRHAAAARADELSSPVRSATPVRARVRGWVAATSLLTGAIAALSALL